jgi:hypothetical protein
VEDINEQFARRDRYRQHLESKKTPERRMAEMAQLQARAWKILQNSPDGYAWFMKRNYRSRAIQVQDEWQR